MALMEAQVVILYFSHLRARVRTLSDCNMRSVSKRSTLVLYMWYDIRKCSFSVLCLAGDFGQVIGSTFSALENKSVLKSNTTLYCVSANSNDPEVTWSYTDAVGTQVELISTTNSTTGVSILLVNTTHPGYYSCEVSQDQGTSTTFTAIVANIIAGMSLFLFVFVSYCILCIILYYIVQWMLVIRTPLEVGKYVLIRPCKINNLFLIRHF